MRILLMICLPLFLLPMTGCASLFKTKPEQIEPPALEKTASNEAMEVETDPSTAGSIEGQLAAAAKSIEKSLNTLASAQEAESPPILQTEHLITPEGGMGNTANIDWSGPIAPLIEQLAHMTDYRLKILGTPPAIPIIINITAKRIVIAEILQNASFQAGRRVHIVVSPGTRVIELRYLSA